MRPVMQTRFGGGEGNCLNACVASILGLPLGAGGVPEGHDDLRPWLLERDLGIVWVDRHPGTVLLAGAGHYYIASGDSPRNAEIAHAILMSDGQEAHDPHPDGTFIAGFIKQWGFVIRMGLEPEGAAVPAAPPGMGKSLALSPERQLLFEIESEIIEPLEWEEFKAARKAAGPLGKRLHEMLRGQPGPPDPNVMGQDSAAPLAGEAEEPKIHSVDLHMFEGPGWDLIRENALKAKPEPAPEPTLIEDHVFKQPAVGLVLGDNECAFWTRGKGHCKQPSERHKSRHKAPSAAQETR